jgi:hypothetical protein
MMAIEFDFRPLDAGLAAFNPKLEMYIDAVVDRQATVATGWMKSNAKWKDRTGNARSALRGIPGRTGNTWFIDLIGGMPYQIWLEVRWAGKYAIIRPALTVQGAALMKNLEGLLERLR